MSYGAPSSLPRVLRLAISTKPPRGSWTDWPRTTKPNRALRAHGRYLGAITLHQPPSHRPHIAFSDHVGPCALGQHSRFLGIAQQPHHVTGELGRIVGQRANVTVLVRQSLSAQAGGDYRNSGSERLQKFDAHTG